MDWKTIPMTPERWIRIKNIFEAAQSIPARERVEMICALSQGDRELELAVRDLLAADESAGGFLQTPAADVHNSVINDEAVHFLAPGEIISKRFEILRFINRGGMGEVYEAWDPELKDRIALKTIRPYIANDPMIIQRFKREVKQARGISHANVCRVYDLVCHQQASGEQIWFLAMELLEGQTLLERIRERGPLKIFAALKLIEQIVAGLAAAHELGIVHRDFKSSNVMLVETRSGHTRAVVTDFGLALNVSAPGEGLPEPGGQGTPAYMAPEQRKNGQVGVAADQYALGIVLSEMLTGLRPTRIDDPEPARGCAVRLSHYRLRPRARNVISRCLQVEPQRPLPHPQGSLAGPQASNAHDRLARRRTGRTDRSGDDRRHFHLERNPARLTELVQVTPATDFSESPSLSRDGGHSRLRLAARHC